MLRRLVSASAAAAADSGSTHGTNSAGASRQPPGLLARPASGSAAASNVTPSPLRQRSSSSSGSKEPLHPHYAAVFLADKSRQALLQARAPRAWKGAAARPLACAPQRCLALQRGRPPVRPASSLAASALRSHTPRHQPTAAARGAAARGHQRRPHDPGLQAAARHLPAPAAGPRGAAVCGWSSCQLPRTGALQRGLWVLGAVLMGCQTAAACWAWCGCAHADPRPVPCHCRRRWRCSTRPGCPSCLSPPRTSPSRVRVWPQPLAAQLPAAAPPLPGRRCRAQQRSPAQTHGLRPPLPGPAVAEDVPAREAGDLTAAALDSPGALTPVARLKLLQGGWRRVRLGGQGGG